MENTLSKTRKDEIKMFAKRYALGERRKAYKTPGAIVYGYCIDPQPEPPTTAQEISFYNARVAIEFDVLCQLKREQFRGRPRKTDRERQANAEAAHEAYSQAGNSRSKHKICIDIAAERGSNLGYRITYKLVERDWKSIYPDDWKD